MVDLEIGRQSVLLVGAAFLGAFASAAVNTYLEDWINPAKWLGIIITAAIFVGLAYLLLLTEKKAREKAN